MKIVLKFPLHIKTMNFKSYVFDPSYKVIFLSLSNYY